MVKKLIILIKFIKNKIKIINFNKKPLNLTHFVCTHTQNGYFYGFLPLSEPCKAQDLVKNQDFIFVVL